MRSKYFLAGATILFLAGCRHETPVEAPKSAVALYADLFARIPAKTFPDLYDIRTPAGAASLTAALKPFDQALDEAQGVVKFSTYPDVFMKITGKDDGATAKTGLSLKNLVNMLVARARLECAAGQMPKSLADFNAAARVAEHVGQNPGSLLQVLIGVADREIVLRGLSGTAMDSSLSAKDALQLAKVPQGVLDLPPLTPALQQELVATNARPPAKAKETAKDRAEYAQLLTAVKEEQSNPLETLKRLRRLSGSDAFPTDVAGLSHLSTGQMLHLVFKQLLQTQAHARMTIGYFNALAENDTKSKFPSTLPLTGANARDPFGDGQLAYRRTSDGFIFTAPASHGLIQRIDGTITAALTYPPKTYPPLKL